MNTTRKDIKFLLLIVLVVLEVNLQVPWACSEFYIHIDKEFLFIQER